MATVIAGFQVLPNGKDVDTDGVIPKMVEVIKASGLKYTIGPMETAVEGEFDDIMELIKAIHQIGKNMEISETLTNIKLHYKEEGISIGDKMTSCR